MNMGRNLLDRWETANPIGVVPTFEGRAVRLYGPKIEGLYLQSLDNDEAWITGDSVRNRR
jgi:hypothetical protein